MSESHMNYDYVEPALQSVHASLRALIQDVCYGTRGRIASTHLTRALTEVIAAIRHVEGQKRISASDATQEIVL